MTDAVSAEELAKSFRVPVRGRSGLRASVGSLVHREYRVVDAVHGVSFTVEPGEVVGFLGPNGAGKTTTIKMLAGLLLPSSGRVRVLGFDPFLRHAGFLGRITMLMGNRNQLQWDLPVVDSFELRRAIYRIPRERFVTARDELIDLLELGGIVDKPVRQLSLGERMRAELAGSLLHEPEVLFLDEPTLGLDVTVQRRVRRFIADYNAKTGASILLTSHYMADVEALCQRVLVIHQGRLLFDGALSALADRFASTKTITVQVRDESSRTDIDAAVAEAAARGVDVLDVEAGGPGAVTVTVARADAPAAAALLLERLDVLDVSVEDPPLEDVIDRVFTGA
jgi:viologen exporter family transport system ATP-binding protein